MAPLLTPIAVVTPGADGDHPWVHRFVEALGRRRQARLIRLDPPTDGWTVVMPPDELNAGPSQMTGVYAERSKAVGKYRRAWVERHHLTHERPELLLQVYTNDSLPLNRIDAVFTDVTLSIIVEHAHLLDGYEWDEVLLQSALAREEQVLRSASTVFLPTRWAADQLVRLVPGIDPKVVVVGWGPGIEYTAETSGPPTEGQDVTLLFVGNDGQRKGLARTLRAFRQLRDRVPTARLVVAGDAGSSGCADAAAGVEMVGKLDWRDQCDLETLRALYRAADLFVMPSQFEPVGCAYIEAMMAGIPVVAQAVGPVPEVVGPDSGWLTSSDTDEDLAALMQTACSSAVERRRRGAAAQKWAERNFGWDRVARIVVSRMEEATANA